MHNEFMAFITEEGTSGVVRSWADKQGFPSDAVQSGGPDLLATLLESDPAPKFAFVDFDDQEDAVQSATRLVSLCGPNCYIVGMGSANDVSLFRGLLVAGIHDYLVKPVTAEMLTQSMITYSQGAKGGVGGKTIHDTKNIIFVGVRGGVGASSLAANTAWVLAHEDKHKIALLDLDMQYGTSALALDIEPGHGLRDVLSSPQRVDNLMIAGALISESEMFGILSAEEPVEEPIHVDPHAVMALLREMKSSYHSIIIDLPRYLLATQKRVLATAHEIVLVTEMSLVGIRDTLRIRTMLKNLGSSARITQVATKVGSSRPAAIDDVTFTKGAQAKIDFLIPDDHRTMVAASNSGKMLGSIAPSAPLTKAVRDLAHHLTKDESVPEKGEKKGGILGGLLGSKGAPKT